MIDQCTHLNDLLKAEVNIMNRHIDEHKWFQHITDVEKATKDFLDKYGWLMKEMYCGYVCLSRQECNLAKEYFNENKTKSLYR